MVALNIQPVAVRRLTCHAFDGRRAAAAAPARHSRLASRPVIAMAGRGKKPYQQSQPQRPSQPPSQPTVQPVAEPVEADAPAAVEETPAEDVVAPEPEAPVPTGPATPAVFFRAPGQSDTPVPAELSMEQRLAALKDAKKLTQQEEPEAEDGGAATTQGGGKGIIDGAVEEVKLIDWPTLPSVLGSTAIVLAVVAVSTLGLLSVNLLLSQLSGRLFG